MIVAFAFVQGMPNWHKRSLERRETESEALPEKKTQTLLPAVGTEAHRVLFTEYWGQGHGPTASYQHAHFGAYRNIHLGSGKSFICHGVNGGPCGGYGGG